MNNPNHIHYNLKSTGLELTQEIRDYLDKKIPHIEKFLQGTQLSVLDVELTVGGEQSRRYHAVFNIVADKNTLHAAASGDGIHEAIDIAIDELSREASKIKTKKLSSVRGGALRVKEFFRGFRKKP